MKELERRAAQKAAGAVRHTAANMLRAAGDWCQKLVNELDTTAAHWDGQQAAPSGSAAREPDQ